jgi:hypothetical protein
MEPSPVWVDSVGFEHTDTQEQLSKLSFVTDQYALQSQERDLEWERYIGEHGMDAIENRRNDPRLCELVSKGFPDKYRKEVRNCVVCCCDFFNFHVLSCCRTLFHHYFID